MTEETIDPNHPRIMVPPPFLVRPLPYLDSFHINASRLLQIQSRLLARHSWYHSFESIRDQLKPMNHDSSLKSSWCITFGNHFVWAIHVSPMLASYSKQTGPCTPHGSSYTRTPIWFIHEPGQWFTSWSNPTPTHDPPWITIQCVASNHHPT